MTQENTALKIQLYFKFDQELPTSKDLANAIKQDVEKAGVELAVEEPLNICRPVGGDPHAVLVFKDGDDARKYLLAHFNGDERQVADAIQRATAV